MTTNDKIAEYIDGFYEPLSEELCELRKVAEAKHIPIILRDTERFIAVMLEMKKPKNILEIGTAIGYSATFMASYVKMSDWGNDSKITTIEVDPLYAADAKGTFDGQTNIKLVEGDAREKIGELNTKFDLAFIDAAKSHYQEFWDEVMPYMNKGGVIICDNILMKGMTADTKLDAEGRFVTNIKYMRDFLEYITKKEERTTSCVLAAGDGMSVSVVK